MPSLFLVNTPLHLLESYLLANSSCAEDDNYLVLVHPQGYSEWHKSACLKYITSEAGGFKRVLLLKSFGRDWPAVKACLGNIKINQCFVGSDLGVDNQLLLSGLTIKNYFRLDDGMWSYYNGDRKRSRLVQAYHYIKLQLLEYVYGVKSDLILNTLASGESKAALGDYLFLPQLLCRYSPKTFEINGAMIKQAFDSLIEKGILRAGLAADYNYWLFLSQPITKEGKMSFQDECSCLEAILKQMSNDERLLYKPHPNDDPEKLAYIKEHYPRVFINDSKELVELMVFANNNITKIISYQCSTLLFAHKFSPAVKCISLALLYKKPLDKVYLQLMEQAGVDLVASIDDIRNERG